MEKWGTIIIYRIFLEGSVTDVIRSMTGFGRHRDTVDGLDITVEIKSVNSRYLDCSVKISRQFSYLEEKIKPYPLNIASLSAPIPN